MRPINAFIVRRGHIFLGEMIPDICTGVSTQICSTPNMHISTLQPGLWESPFGTGECASQSFNGRHHASCVKILGIGIGRSKTCKCPYPPPPYFIEWDLLPCREVHDTVTLIIQLKQGFCREMIPSQRILILQLQRKTCQHFIMVTPHARESGILPVKSSLIGVVITELNILALIETLLPPFTKPNTVIVVPCPDGTDQLNGRFTAEFGPGGDWLGK